MSGKHGLWCVVLLGLGVGLARGESVTLVDRGVAKCCVVVGTEESFRDPAQANWAPKATLLKWAAEDVAAYLGKMSGAAMPLDAESVTGMLPIYVGCAPQAGKLAKISPYGDAYVVEVTAKGIVLHGESRRAVDYAAAQLLHELGVRWYAPGEIGEVVPQRKNITVPVGRREFAPDFITRRLWCRPPDETRWMYRNRLGDPTIPAGHSLHAYGADLPGWKERREGRTQHPEYYNVIDGQPGNWINLANPEVATIFAKGRSSCSGKGLARVLRAAR